MPKILILDTYYPGVLDHLAPVYAEPLMDYERALIKTLDLQFGTADFYSRHLRTYGWEARDVIVNANGLQRLWNNENGKLPVSQILHAQIEDFKPDVIFLQDLGLYAREGLERYRTSTFFAGQSSCAIRKDLIQHLRVIFTSFPHYVKKFNGIYGHRFVYNPLAFEPAVLDTVNPFVKIKGGSYKSGDDVQVERIRPLDIAFVGGVGNPSHWSAGLNVLEAVAETFGERFHWYGYGLETLPESSPLRQCYRGPAWGRKMYTVYSDAKIVINRHGEIAQGHSNNMRMYEATGCGALLMTECSKNLHELFTLDEVAQYANASNAVEQINFWLSHLDLLAKQAARGQQRTLKEHTYHNRMKLVSDVLLERMK